MAPLAPETTKPQRDPAVRSEDRLVQRFPDISRSVIEEAVWQEHKALEGGRVRDFVPILVEHAAKARLSR